MILDCIGMRAFAVGVLLNLAVFKGIFAGALFCDFLGLKISAFSLLGLK